MKRGFVLFSVVLLAVLVVPAVQAQDRSHIYFKLGANTQPAGSAVNTRFHYGLGGGYHLFSNLSFEPSLSWRTKNGTTDYQGYFFQEQTKVILTDLNGSFGFSRKRSRFVPYLTGGVGFLRYGTQFNDGYYVYSGGSRTYFSKNLGSGLRVKLGEQYFVGLEAKQYWIRKNNFRTYGLTVGYRF